MTLDSRRPFDVSASASPVDFRQQSLPDSEEPKKRPFDLFQLPELYGNSNPAPGEAPKNISMQLFAKTALEWFDIEDKNKDGYLDQEEIESGAATGIGLRKNAFEVMKKSLNTIKRFSNDEWGDETSISKADLEEFRRLQRTDSKSPAVKRIADALQEQDTRNALFRMREQEGSGKTLTDYGMNSAIQEIAGSSPAKALAHQFKKALINNDPEAFKDTFVKAQTDPDLDESIKILNQAFFLNESDLNLAKTDDKSLILFHRRKSQDLRVDGGLVVGTDGSMKVRPVYSGAKVAVMQTGEVLNQTPNSTFGQYSKDLDTATYLLQLNKVHHVNDWITARQRVREHQERWEYR